MEKLKQFVKIIRGLPIHPLLLSFFCILYYYNGSKTSQVSYELILLCLSTLFIAGVLFICANLIMNKKYKAAVFVSLIIIISYMFDGIYEILIEINWLPSSFRVFLTTMAGQYVLYFSLILIVGILILRKSKYDFKSVSFFLDIVGLTLIISLFFTNPQIKNRFTGNGERRGVSIFDSWEKYTTDFIDKSQPTQSYSGDIYYIVFDAFGSQETLKELYSVSNDDLYQGLKERGFKVIEDGRTNYNQTRFSISSSLNMSYVQQMSVDDVSTLKDGSLPVYWINENILFRFLRNQGYKIVTFSTGLYLNDVKTSDYYFSPPTVPDPFIYEVINNSALSLIYWKQQYLWHTARLDLTLDKVGDLDDFDTPIFVYAHIMLPHPPFVFQDDGEVIIPPKKFDLRDNSSFTNLDSQETYITGYKAQVEYASDQIIKIVDQIQKNSPEAVIIIQGDHGPGAFFRENNLELSNLDEKAHILNAYYFPDGDYSSIPTDMTPVNSFRVVLNKNFGTNLSLLENHTFFSTLDEPYNFTEVDNRLR